MGVLNRIKQTIGKDETVAGYMSRRNDEGPRACQWMDRITARDNRPATPQRIFRATTRVARVGYTGRLLADYIRGQDTAPASDPAAAMSVAAIVARQR